MPTKSELWANPDWCARHWGNRRGKPWSRDDLICAKFLRHCGMTDSQIGEALRRTARSVSGKLGYVAVHTYRAAA